ncbi:MAG: MarR family winged helix-turn-helix transcriptional regulator [Pseudomonadota bacterium]|jgi:MarR family transcriptional regulator for hemolysin
MGTHERRAFVRELVLVARYWRSALDERLREIGLNHMRWAVLDSLRDSAGGVSQTALAAAAGVEPATLVRMIDSMTMDGLVERRPSKEDRRMNLIHMTAEATRLFDRVEQLESELRRSLLAQFRDDEISAVHEILYRLRLQMEGA